MPSATRQLASFFIATAFAAILVSCGKEPGSSQTASPIIPKPTAVPAKAPVATQTPVPISQPSATPKPEVKPPAKPTPAQNTKPPAPPKPSPQPTPVPTPPVRPPIDLPKNDLPTSYYRAAVWAKVANSRAWTETTIHAVKHYQASLEKAADIDSFCPNYSKAKQRSKEICWLRLVGGIASQESQFNPAATFKEPTGEMSIGLLQVSEGQCTLKRVAQLNLIDPVQNLRCGIQIMADLIQKDGYLDGPPWHEGAAAYWSTLRPPYRFLGMLLGKKSEVIAFTVNYSKY